MINSEIFYKLKNTIFSVSISSRTIYFPSTVVIYDTLFQVNFNLYAET